MLHALSPLRKAGILISLASLLLWIVGAYWLLGVSSIGANIGAGLVLLLAIGASLSSLIVLLISLGRAHSRSPRIEDWPRRPLDTTGRIGATLAVLDILAWVLVFTLLSFPVDPTPYEIAGFCLFVAAAALMSSSRT